MSAYPTPSLDPLTDLSQLFTYQFMVNALAAGTIAAVLAASAGWFMVLRRQSFAGHTLSVMAFPGAAGAALLGLPSALGYYLACSAAALTIGATGRGARGGYSEETASIGAVQAVGLGAGFLFLSLNHSVLGGPESLLFGTFLGIDTGQLITLSVVALALLAGLAVIARPLLFCSIDPIVAAARGVPVRLLDSLFLVILGLAVAVTNQITGALLVFALLLAPPAAARLITTRALPGLALSVALSLPVVWSGLAIAYYSPYPVGFFATTAAVVVYLLARVAATRKR